MIDDSPEARALYRSVFGQQGGAEIVEHPRGAGAVALARAADPSIIVLDVRLPDVHGFEVCRALKSDPELRAVPVVHISAVDVQLESRVAGIESGADAYLTASSDPAELLAVAQALVRRYRDEQRRTRQILDQALTDALTGVGNRRAWDAWLADATSAVNAVALIFVIDLDDLKQVNDEQGHHAGDALLRRAAEAIRDAARATDGVARLGGDEFGLLARNCRLQDSDVVAGRLLATLERAGVSASLGRSSTANGRSAYEAWSDADRRMYEEKQRRRSSGTGGRRWSDP